MTVNVVQAEVCDSKTCSTAHLLVRGDRVSFVSSERLRQTNAKREVDKDGRVLWTPSRPVADVVLPKNYVVVHDATGKLLSPCDLYVVRWHKPCFKCGETVQQIPSDVASVAHEYFGKGIDLKLGSVDIPEGPWSKIPGKMALIRYRREGELADDYEHVWEPTVNLYDCARPIAWRLPLPEGCRLDERGFIRP